MRLLRHLFIAVDSFLIDRVFQPISDRLARFASCYAIAAFLLTGALPINFVIGWIDEFWISVVISIIWMPALIYHAYKLDASSLSNVQPTDRIEYRDTRMFLLVIQIIGMPWDISFLYSGDTLNFFQTLSWWLIVFAFFFMACQRNPPKLKTVFVDAMI